MTSKPHIKLKQGIWCIYRTRQSPKPIVMGANFRRVIGIFQNKRVKKENHAIR